MKKIIIILCLLLGFQFIYAQEVKDLTRELKKLTLTNDTL